MELFDFLLLFQVPVQVYYIIMYISFTYINSEILNTQLEHLLMLRQRNESRTIRIN